MTVFDIFINLIEEGIVVFFLFNICAYKEYFKKYYLIIYWILLSIIVMIDNSFFFYGNYLEILSLGCNTIFLFLFSKDSHLGCIAKAILIQLLLLVSAQLSLLLISIFIQIDFIHVDDSMYFTSSIVLSKFILFSLCICTMRFFRKIGTIMMNKTWISVILALLCVKSALEINQKVLITEHMSNSMILFSSFLFFMLSVLLFKIFYDTELQIREKLQRELVIQSYKSSLDNYQYLNEKNQELHEIKHDFKKVLSYYGLLLEQGDINKAKEYLKSFTEKVDAICLPVVVDHMIVNMVLNEKIFLAKRQKLKLKYMVLSKRLSMLNIDDIDLYVLLENVLNNAIENCSSSGFINLEVIDKHQYVKFSVSNSIEQTVLQTNKELHTTKENKEDHGHGIHNMKNIVNNCQGVLCFYEEDHMFYCEISIPIKNT